MDVRFMSSFHGHAGAPRLAAQEPKENSKTKLCYYWACSQGQSCPYGNACFYAHGVAELVVPSATGDPTAGDAEASRDVATPAYSVPTAPANHLRTASIPASAKAGVRVGDLAGSASWGAEAEEVPVPPVSPHLSGRSATTAGGGSRSSIASATESVSESSSRGGEEVAPATPPTLLSGGAMPFAPPPPPPHLGLDEAEIQAVILERRLRLSKKPCRLWLASGGTHCEFGTLCRFRHPPMGPRLHQQQQQLWQQRPAPYRQLDRWAQQPPQPYWEGGGQWDGAPSYAGQAYPPPPPSRLQEGGGGQPYYMLMPHPSEMYYGRPPDRGSLEYPHAHHRAASLMQPPPYAQRPPAYGVYGAPPPPYYEGSHGGGYGGGYGAPQSAYPPAPPPEYYAHDDVSRVPLGRGSAGDRSGYEEAASASSGAFWSASANPLPSLQQQVQPQTAQSKPPPVTSSESGGAAAAAADAASASIALMVSSLRL